MEKGQCCVGRKGPRGWVLKYGGNFVIIGSVLQKDGKEDEENE